MKLLAQASIDEYAHHLWVSLDLVCGDCKSRYEASKDILPEEENSAPNGHWAHRHAIASRDEGWWIQPSRFLVDEIPCILCPVCVVKHGIDLGTIDDETA